MPLAILISVITFVLIIVIIRIEDINQILEDNLHKTAFTLIMTFFFSVGMYLYSETKNIARVKKELYQIITISFGFLFFYFFEENLFSNPQAEIVVYCVSTFLGIIAFIFIAPFISKLRAKNLSQEEFYITTYALLIKAIMSIIVGLAVMILGFIAFQSIFTLFDIDNINEGNWFSYWATFSLILFASIFFLVNLPVVKKCGEKELSEIQTNKFYSFLINYVGTPAIFIYFLILYAYTLKVLINFSNWPQGEVTWLVILFSFFGYIVYFATYAFTNVFKSALILRKFLPLAIFLQTFMLFYAIGLRINQYDLTINRYLVVAFGLWLFALSLYFIISKKKGLSAPFYSLLIVIIFISIGPWSVYHAPEWRQQKILEFNLREANILQTDDNIVMLKDYKDIPEKLSGKIYSGIDYLCNYHGCNTLDKYFNTQIAEIKKEDKEKFEKNKKKQLEQANKMDDQDDKYIEKLKKQKYSEIGKYELVHYLTEKIKVKKYNQNNKILKNFNFKNKNSHFDESIDIRGYDYFVQIHSNNYKIEERKKSPNMYKAVLDVFTKKFELYFNETLVETFEIEETIINPLLKKKNNYLDDKYENEQIIVLAKEDMSFEFIGVHYNLKLVLENINIRNPEWVDDNDKSDDNERTNYEKMQIPMLETSYVNGYVLIKKK
ncbi:MAG: DUF4153 domain-containing protein [Patescibacteria group bacterium]|nr:DUF4153 domain-containing protein [Patescibacteria group bacterium]